MAMAFSDTVDYEVDLDVVRHVSLDGIRFINSKFRREYGDPVIAIDTTKGSWRKQVFPYYKAQRSTDRKKSDIDWASLLQHVNTIKQELIECFPYKVIEVDHAEADDIIGILTKKAVSEDESVMIISGDKDFIQLQAGTDLVQQWDKRKGEFIGAESPKRYLFEHVLKGDRGDGIPNILSPSDSFVNKIRQRPMTQVKIDQLWENKEELKQYPRFMENLKIIDLSFTPKPISEKIVAAYENYEINDRSKMTSYLIEKRLKKLYEQKGEF